jgi:hypothetical protein|tara:strand:- start:173 stop:499 length:327 start_codon:yes stop_codon:yes gene_type:complete
MSNSAGAPTQAGQEICRKCIVARPTDSSVISDDGSDAGCVLGSAEGSVDGVAVGSATIASLVSFLFSVVIIAMSLLHAKRVVNNKNLIFPPIQFYVKNNKILSIRRAV